MSKNVEIAEKSSIFNKVRNGSFLCLGCKSGDDGVDLWVLTLRFLYRNVAMEPSSILVSQVCPLT